MSKLKRNWKNVLNQSLWIIYTLLVLPISTGAQIWPHDNSVTISPSICISYEAQFICDCKMVNEHLVLPHLIGSAYQLEIRNCQSLTIESNALQETQHLHKIIFKNVENLVLNQHSLTLPDYSSSTPLILSFEKVKIKLIDSLAINGQIEEITIVDSYIESIRPFAFNILKNNALRLTMDRVQIKRIEPQAFKKLVVEKIDIQNCEFLTNVPSKTFYDIEVSDSLLLSNVRFKTVHTKAFSFKMISKLTIANNYFEAVDAEWLEAFVKKSPLLRDNQFGNTSEIAFKGIKVHRDYGSSEKLELRFSNNTIHFPRDNVQPLEFSKEFTLNIKQLNMDNPYPCTDIDYNSQILRPKSEFYNHYQHNVYFRQDATTTSQGTRASYKPLNEIINNDCSKHSYWIYIIIGVVVLLILIALIIVIACWLAAKKRKAKRKMDIIQPEPRTYKETQIVYQIENAGLLKTDF
uniref:Leucine rich repeat protein n=1 Tax=Musca domestica TaxID=7370 RepID=T1PEK7_MUSDO